jgi:hypothetical protein
MVSIAATAAGSPFFQYCVELPDDRRQRNDPVSAAACRGRSADLDYFEDREREFYAAP